MIWRVVSAAICALANATMASEVSVPRALVVIAASCAAQEHPHLAALRLWTLTQQRAIVAVVHRQNQIKGREVVCAYATRSQM